MAQVVELIAGRHFIQITARSITATTKLRPEKIDLCISPRLASVESDGRGAATAMTRPQPVSSRALMPAHPEVGKLPRDRRDLTVVNNTVWRADTVASKTTNSMGFRSEHSRW